MHSVRRSPQDGRRSAAPRVGSMFAGLVAFRDATSPRNLYLSDRTVKYHHAMRKLKVSSRRQLPDILEPERLGRRADRGAKGSPAAAYGTSVNKTLS